MIYGALFHKLNDFLMVTSENKEQNFRLNKRNVLRIYKEN